HPFAALSIRRTLRAGPRAFQYRRRSRIQPWKEHPNSRMARAVTLGQKQRRFTLLVAKLIEYAYSQGYELSFGEAYRTPEQAKANAKSGKGIANSLHCDRLAIDLNLFKDGTYLTSSESH